jgi:hypothetical protein
MVGSLAETKGRGKKKLSQNYSDLTGVNGGHREKDRGEIHTGMNK